MDRQVTNARIAIACAGDTKTDVRLNPVLAFALLRVLASASALKRIMPIEFCVLVPVFRAKIASRASMPYQTT
jgi:hypothetical protein